MSEWRRGPAGGRAGMTWLSRMPAKPPSPTARLPLAVAGPADTHCMLPALVLKVECICLSVYLLVACLSVMLKSGVMALADGLVCFAV